MGWRANSTLNCDFEGGCEPGSKVSGFFKNAKKWRLEMGSVVCFVKVTSLQLYAISSSYKAPKISPLSYITKLLIYYTLMGIAREINRGGGRWRAEVLENRRDEFPPNHPKRGEPLRKLADQHTRCAQNVWAIVAG